MALAYNSIGGAQTFTSGATSLTVPYPATTTTPGTLLLIVATHPETVTITDPTGWVLAGTQTGGTGTFGSQTGPCKIAAWTTEAVGQSGSVTVTVSAATSSSIWARILYITRAAGTVINTGFSGGSDNTTGTAWSAAHSANPGLTAGDLFFSALAIPTSTLPTFASDALTATGGTFTQNFVQNPTSSAGNAIGGRIGYFTLTGTATAAPTHTITLSGTTTNDAGPDIGVRLREVVPNAPSLIVVRQAINRAASY